LAAAAPKTREAILANDRIPPNPGVMERHTQTRLKASSLKLSDAGCLFFTGLTAEKRKFTSRSVGISAAARILQATDLTLIPQLTPEEKQRARKLVVEMQEILDDIDQRLGPDTSVNS
jgi:hypothetical protein